MNPSSDNGQASPDVTASPDPRRNDPPRANWRKALMSLIAARVALIQLESKDATRAATRRTSLYAACGFFALFGWGLLLASGVSLLSKATGWPWDWVAMGLAGIHLLVAAVLTQTAKPSGNASFPVTRAEFQKDREWIENFNKNRNSTD